jgi:KUP system potassium uptake protein
MAYPSVLTNVVGILSLIFWSLVIVVSLKYVAFIMRADNNGEGGILSLLALALRKKRLENWRRGLLMGVGLFGAALFFGDGMITPAISVLSAVEGLKVAAPVLDPLCHAHHHSCPRQPVPDPASWHRLGRHFFWSCHAGLVQHPGLAGHHQYQSSTRMYSISSIRFGHPVCLEHQVIAFVVMGAVVLTVTGGEALYADMGHFGRKPISRYAWFFVVFPALCPELLWSRGFAAGRPHH